MLTILLSNLLYVYVVCALICVLYKPTVDASYSDPVFVHEYVHPSCALGRLHEHLNCIGLYITDPAQLGHVDTFRLQIKD